MTERIKVREKELEATSGWSNKVRGNAKDRLMRGMVGKVVISGDERDWEEDRQGRRYWFLNAVADDSTALQDWYVWCHDVKAHSGMHKHKGGVIIYVLEGSGYTLIEGERVEWEKGDLMLLPLTAGGVAHQHFNNNPDEPCRWVGFIYLPIRNALVSDYQQLKDSSRWQEKSR